MNRPSSSDSRLAAWLEEGPTSGPNDALADALARVRSTRQRPGWLERLKGDPMETTWRARPVPSARMALVLLIALLVLALGASLVIVGSRLLAPPRPDPNNGVVIAPIPHGGEAVLAYSVFERDDGNGDVYTIRADGTDRRHVGRGLDPIFSPDGSMIAFYTNPAPFDGWDLMLADASGVRMLAGQIGCHGYGPDGAPVWSPDSRFIIYLVFRGNSADCGSLDSNYALQDFYVIPADGSSHGHRMLAGPASGFDSAWSPSGAHIAFQVTDGINSSLWVAEVTDPAAPWGLTSHQISDPGTYNPEVSWGLPRWSPDETKIATTIQAVGDVVTADSIVIAADGSGKTLLWPGSEVDDGYPSWSPDGKRLSIVGHLGSGNPDTDAYDLYLVDPDGGNRQRINVPRLRAYPGGAPFSPDGTRVIERSLGGSSLKVITLDGSAEPVDIVDGDTAVSWQPVIAPLPPDQPHNLPATSATP